jgi:SMC interacting uncharacterized protein involved in chromosome segregation
MKAVDKIVVEDDGERLRKLIAELESENCELKAAVTEASGYYEVLQLGNSSVLAEHNEFCYQCEDLEDELKKAHSDSAVSIATLEAKVKSAEAHSSEVAAASDKHLSDFEAGLIKDLAGLQKLYVHNI